MDFKLKTTSGDIAYNTAESGICENMGMTVGVSLLAHPNTDIIVFPVWRPPSWIFGRKQLPVMMHIAQFS